MASIVELSDGESDFTNEFQAYLQSGNINFLLGSGASAPAISLAGSIEAEINTFLANDNETAAERKAYEFIKNLSAQHDALLAGTTSAALQGVVDDYSAFVKALDKILFERKNLLLPRQVNIFTTNYDMLIEHVSSRMPSLILNDGFARNANVGSDFLFSPEQYFDRTYRSGLIYSQKSEVPTLNLVKLHGSLSWKKKGDTLVYDAKAVPALAEADENTASEITAYLEKYFLILPNLRKFHSAMMDRVYYDLLRIFANSLERENALLVAFGFSFEDEHILDICRRALRNPTAQLLLFCHKPEGAARLQEKFSAQRNARVVAPSAGGVLDFKRLNTLLNAALPAEA